MSQPNKTSAFLAYLLPVLGWFYVFIASRNDKFAIYHTKQSMMIIIMAIVAPLIWAIFSWFVAFIPYGGVVIAVASFGLVITLYIVLIMSWIIGMVYALQAKLKPIPLVGNWAERLPID